MEDEKGEKPAEGGRELPICDSERVRRETALRSSLRVGVDLTVAWRGGGGGGGSVGSGAIGRAGRRVGEEVELELWEESSSESEEAVWCHGRVLTPRTRFLRLGSLGKGTGVPVEEGR